MKEHNHCHKTEEQRSLRAYFTFRAFRMKWSFTRKDSFRRYPDGIHPSRRGRVAMVRSSPLVSLPLNGYGKVEADFCSDRGGMKEHSISYATEEQRRYGQKDQDLVCSEFSGNDTSRGSALRPSPIPWERTWSSFPPTCRVERHPFPALSQRNGRM